MIAILMQTFFSGKLFLVNDNVCLAQQATIVMWTQQTPLTDSGAGSKLWSWLTCNGGLYMKKKRPERSCTSSFLLSILLLFSCLSRSLLVAAAYASQPTPKSAALLSVSDWPCVYSGHVQTARDWYGYLANVTVMLTGRMTFEFSYPADKCCLSVLFYLDDQMGVNNARTNCWQKEAVLSAENDQILRLTPRFSWSGCHMDYPRGLPTYVCQGGRSFTSGSNGQSDRPTTWYLAVSNCATLMGIDLRYKLTVYGQVGECKSGHRYDPSFSGEHDDGRLPSDNNVEPSNSHSKNSGGAFNPKTGEVIRQPDDGNRVAWNPREHNSASRVNIVGLSGDSSSSSSSSNYNVNEANPGQGKVCVIRGTLVTNQTWHGFIANISVGAGGGFRYNFAYPFDMQVQNVLLYADHDLVHLRKTLAKTKEACVYREHVIRSEDWLEKMLDLKFTAAWNGCISRNSTKSGSSGANGANRLEVYCQSERRFNSPKTLYVAVSNCYSSNGLQLDYRFEVTGFEGRMACSPAVPQVTCSPLSVLVTLALALTLLNPDLCDVLPILDVGWLLLRHSCRLFARGR